MGIRSKIKGRLKAALGASGKTEAPDEPKAAKPESKHLTSISQDTGAGNLRDTGDVPWYLKYDDNDGWESTNVESEGDDD